MAKKAFVSLTGGLNNVDRPDTLEEDQLQECVNYEITGVGKLEKRTDPSEYSTELTTQLKAIFTEIIFVSDPYYPPNKIQGDYEDFMLFVYGIKKSTNDYSMEIAIPATRIEKVWTGEYGIRWLYGRRRRYRIYENVPTFGWTFKNEKGDSYLQDLYDAGLKYTEKSAIDISIGDRNAYISDGVNPIHKITITSRGEIVSSYAGLKAPKNKPRISLEELGEQYDSKRSAITYTGDVNDATLGGIGLLQVQYTVVMSTGEESNPSPMSDWANGQFFKIGEDGVSDERLIKSITVYDLNIPDIPNNLRKDLKYFKIYYRIVRYSEGVELDSMEFSTQEEIKKKVIDAVGTGNDYTISTVKSVGQVVSYENDAGLPCKVSAVNAGIVMIGGVTKNAAIPGSFQYMSPITIRNQNNKNYVDAVVQVKLSKDDFVDDYGNTLMNGWHDYFLKDSVYMSGANGIKWKDLGVANPDYYSRHLRMYDTDMTTPIMVFVPFAYESSGSNITIYVKIPLLSAAADHTIYFCWNKIKDNLTNDDIIAGIADDVNLISGHTGIEDVYNDVSQKTNIEESFTWENNIGIHYGRWGLSSDLTNVAQSRQQVFQPRRVPSGSTEILTAPNTDELGLGDSENSLYDLPNRANLNNNGEATSIDDPLIVQNSIDPPTGSPIQFTEDTTYEFGGEWTPTTATQTYNHNNFNKHNAQTHHGAPLHNAYSDDLDDDGNVIGYYVRKDPNGTENADDHTHTVAASPGSWGGDTYDIQTYKYDAIKIENDNIIGSTRGLAPITTLDSTGDNLDDYSLLNGLAWTTFPTGLDKIYRIPGVFNLKLPVLQETSDNVRAEYDSDGNTSEGFVTRQSYHSVGAFKPWCGGWSFRKQAISMGQIPDRGYMYTTITFRKADLADSGDTSSELGITLGGTRWNNYNNKEYDGGKCQLNTIFYISCGAINDVDALPNHPVEFTDDHYDSGSQLGAGDVKSTDSGYADNSNVTQDILSEENGRQTSTNGNFLPRTPGYNRDNFKAVSITGLSPGDLQDEGLTIQEGGTGLPQWKNGSIGGRSYTHYHEKHPNDPKRNLIIVRLIKQTSTYYPEGTVSLKLNIAGYNPKHNNNLYIAPISTVDAQDYVSVFVYLSWDLLDEKLALGWSLVDDETSAIVGDFSKGHDNHYGKMNLVEYDLTDSDNVPEGENFKDRFKDKALYDIGLGNSTYINRVVSGVRPGVEEQAQQITQSGYHGFYGATELTVGDYVTNNDQILAMRNGTPRFDIPVGVNWSDYSQNNNISFAATKEQVDKVYDNMIMWSEVGRDGFPDLNYKLLKEPVVKIFSAPSFLKFEYSNTFIIWTRNTINRFVLKGTASGWSGSSESLIEEQLQFGLFAPKSLVKIGAEMVWFSEEGVIRWNPEGMQNISSNVIDIPLNGNYMAFYCPLRNQYILHDNATYISYAYDMTYRMWTTFKGLNIASASILSRGSESENFNLLLNPTKGTLYQYPGTDRTSEDARIKTMDLFMDSGLIKRVKVAYNGDSDAKLTYNLAYNDKDSNNIERSQTISSIEKNTWRGLGDLGRVYGRVANFEIENADEIFTIIYDAVTQGGE